MTRVEGACADDLWHFTLIFLIVFVGFGAVAYVNFGSSQYQFHAIGPTFESLFDMMLGSMPKSGSTGSAAKSLGSDPLLVVFVALFNFLVFFVMLYCPASSACFTSGQSVAFALQAAPTP